MRFLILLIGLGLERFLNVSDLLHRFNWFTSYLNFERKYLQKKNLWRGYIGLLFVILPLLIITALLYYPFSHALFGFFRFIAGLFIFIYCLGPKDLYAQLERYFHANEVPQGDAEQTVVDIVSPLQTSSLLPFNRKLSRGMLWSFNQRIFAVSFWFLIAGPLGAVLYRAVTLLRDEASRIDSPEKEMLSAAELIHNILDWLPTRLASLGYALMGNFMHGFAYWMKHSMSGLDKNEEVAVNCGLASLEIEPHQESDIEENKMVLGLLDRTLVMYLILVAVFTLGSLAY